jgi:Zn-finger nucleic acid-binding protein
MQVDAIEDARTCRHCGSVEQRAEIIRHLDMRSTSENRCPSCATPLSQARLDGFPLLLCERCEGMLIEMQHFVSIIDAARALEEPSRGIPPRRQSPGDRTIPCPVCRQPMLNHFYGGPGNLVIDTCESCDVNWLDPGELRRIARAS